MTQPPLPRLTATELGELMDLLSGQVLQGQMWNVVLYKHLKTEAVYMVRNVSIRENDMVGLVSYSPHVDCLGTLPIFTRPISEFLEKFEIVRR